MWVASVTDCVCALPAGCWWRGFRMSAGTVVIAGGVLATVILLTIVAVLCLCRLQVRLTSHQGHFQPFLLGSNVAFCISFKAVLFFKSGISQKLWRFSSPSLWPNSSITAARGRSQKRGKRRKQSLPPCLRAAPWLCQLPLRLQRQTATAMKQRPTLPPSSPRPTGRPASLRHRHLAAASARTPSAHPALAARCPFTCSTRSACATAAAGSATGLCTRRTWNCLWTWPACTTSWISSARLAWGPTTASARTCRSSSSSVQSRKISPSLLLQRGCNTESCGSWRLLKGRLASAVSADARKLLPSFWPEFDHFGTVRRIASLPISLMIFVLYVF